MAYNIVVICGNEWSELWRTTVVLHGANISWVQNLTHKQVEWFLKGGTPQCNIAYKCIQYMSIILVDDLRVCSVLDTLPMKRVSTSTFQVCKNCTLRRVPWFFHDFRPSRSLDQGVFPLSYHVRMGENQDLYWGEHLSEGRFDSPQAWGLPVQSKWSLGTDPRNHVPIQRDVAGCWDGLGQVFLLSVEQIIRGYWLPLWPPW